MALEDSVNRIADILEKWLEGYVKQHKKEDIHNEAESGVPAKKERVVEAETEVERNSTEEKNEIVKEEMSKDEVISKLRTLAVKLGTGEPIKNLSEERFGGRPVHNLNLEELNLLVGYCDEL